jgi:zinc transporter
MRGWTLALLPDGTIADGAGAAATFTWHHLDGREAGALDWLKAESGIPASAIRALTAVETRPRTEQYDGGALINLRGLGATPEDDPDPLVSIRIWATGGRVVSVSFRTLDGIDRLSDDMKAGRLHDPGDLIASLALHVTERLDPEIADLGDRLDECETALAPDRAFALRRTIGQLRSRAISYRRFVAPQRQALERLAALDCRWLDDADRLHLRDAADRFARMAEELEAIRERSALLHEQLTDLRAEVLETRTLVVSVVALVFLPLTFLTGLLGMNVAGIPFAREPWAFWGVVGFCLALATGVAGYFARSRWFR